MTPGMLVFPLELARSSCHGRILPFSFLSGVLDHFLPRGSHPGRAEGAGACVGLLGAPALAAAVGCRLRLSAAKFILLCREGAVKALPALCPSSSWSWCWFSCAAGPGNPPSPGPAWGLLSAAPDLYGGPDKGAEASRESGEDAEERFSSWLLSPGDTASGREKAEMVL